MVQSWKQGTSFARDHRDGGTHRVYQGTGNNAAVTERPGRAASPSRIRRSTVSPYDRAPSPQARYRNASPQRYHQDPHQTYQHNNVNSEDFIQHRSPSPQRRYQERRTEPVPMGVDDGRSMKPRSVPIEYDRSYAQSQKQMQQSRLEEQVSALHYKLGQMEIQLQRHKQKAEDAVMKCERMERDQHALKREHEAALKAATEAAAELAEWKEREGAKAVVRLNQQLEDKTKLIAELREDLATALSERDDALKRASQQAGVMTHDS